MRYPFKLFFHLIALSFIMMAYSSCATNEPYLIEEIEIDQNLNILSDAVTERNVELLWDLKDSSNERISGSAWRALAITQIDDLRDLINLAIDKDQAEAWYVLRFQNLSELEIEVISTHFFTSDAKRGPICSFFFSKGDDWTLEMLLKNSEIVLDNRKCAMAVGGMLTRIKVSEEYIQRVLELLSETVDSEIKSYLLYGFWRSALNRPNQGTDSYEKLVQLLESRKNSQPALVDEFLIRLTGAQGFNFVMNNRSGIDLTEHVQLSVELARAVRFLEGENLDKNEILRLLNHTNPHVSVMTLESLKELDNHDPSWLTGFSELLVHFPENAEVSITTLELLQMNDVEIPGMDAILDEIDQNHPYLKNRTLGLFKERLDSETYLAKILDNLDREGIEAQHAAVALSEFANNFSTPSEIRDRIRISLSDAILSQNRSVITASGQLLTNRYYFDENDRNLFMEGYTQAYENQNFSVAQLLFGVMTELSLIEDDFNPDFRLNDFQNPDWQRILELGDAPHWVLNTDRGEIVIQLDPRTAPFTVSSIDSLTRAGLYDGVNFHRVVRNFVIQGGDFDRRDGLGGPGYRIPTEPAQYTFKRGAAGIASSGQDTEGSQFFITHTWTPHLDGLYTIFGEVIHGMDVVDRIQIGDVVLSAEIIK